MIESHPVTARPKPVVLTVSCTVVHSTMNTAPKTMYKQYTQLTHRVVCIPHVVYKCCNNAQTWHMTHQRRWSYKQGMNVALLQISSLKSPFQSSLSTCFMISPLPFLYLIETLPLSSRVWKYTLHLSPGLDNAPCTCTFH